MLALNILLQPSYVLFDLDGRNERECELKIIDLLEFSRILGSMAALAL
jgi:hypothetical protein